MTLVTILKFYLSESLVKCTRVNICLTINIFCNDRKQEDALSPTVLSFALEYAIRNVHETQAKLKLNGIHQLMAFVDDVNELRDNINTIKKTQNF